MRAYRFMDRQEKGIWYPDNELSLALIDNRAMLSLVSIERVWSELERIIVGKNAHVILSRMNDDGVLSAIFGYPFAKEIFDLIEKLPEDLEARIAMLFTYLKLDEVSVVLKRFKCSNKLIGRAKLLHFLLHKTPDKHDLRIYRNQLGEEVKTHIFLMDAIGADISGFEEDLKKFRQNNRNIQGSPGLLLEEDRLKRELVSLERVYTTLKSQYEITRIEEIGSSKLIMILDKPEIPMMRISPKRKDSVMKAGFFGFVISIFLTYFGTYIIDIYREIRS